MELSTETNINELRKSLKFVGKWEWGNDPNGGYTNDPADPGGETKWGISKRAHPNEDIKNLTLERATDIYYTEYWRPAGCDSIPFPSNGAVFDTAVNCGVSRAVTWWDETKENATFLERRKQYYIQIVNKRPTQMKYWKGWMNRLNDLKKFVITEQPS